MSLFPDFQDFVEALNQAEVKYMLVGGYALAAYRYPRNTMDMDIWIERTEENYMRALKAFQIFGMPIFDFNKENFFDPKFDVFGIGRKPVRIEILLEVKGLVFAEAYPQSTIWNANGLNVTVVGYDDLIKAKKAAGRLKDLADIEELGAIHGNET